MRHPAGLLIHNGTLFALDQLAQALLTFDVTSGTFQGLRIPKLPDKPEDVILVPNNC
jgi:hypothetical protein